MTCLIFFLDKASFDLNNTPYEQAPSFLKSERCFIYASSATTSENPPSTCIFEHSRTVVIISTSGFFWRRSELLSLLLPKITSYLWRGGFAASPWLGGICFFSLEAGQITPIVWQTLLSADLEVSRGATKVLCCPPNAPSP
ncbi:hypothetical protein Ddc_06130 [Ditylenchus destructor]|nr:hypothetical protein Ddc_06130 [Ditylenchus destructor]